MKKITKTIDLYEFKELEKEIQEELIKKEKQDQLEAYCECCLKNDMEYKATELLKKYFGNKAALKQVFYSLSYCQGDGAMIEFYLSYYGESLEIKQHGFYYHERSFIIENDYNINEKRLEKLKNKIIRMNYDLSEYGYSLIEDTISDDEAIDLLSDFLYTKDGKIYDTIENIENIEK